jgi:DNA-binding XRE family transcriptional regulator
MSYSARELKDRGVAPEAIGWRRWRRERGLTQRAMATMLDMSVRTLVYLEQGVYAEGPASDKLAAFIARWSKVPEMQERMAEEARRTKLRYRAAALARCKARGYEVPAE